MPIPALKYLTTSIGLAAACLVVASCGDEKDTGNPWPGDLDIDCAAIPSGPFEEELLVDGLGFVEDLAFDGLGYFVVDGSTELKKIDAEGAVTTSALESPITGTGGLRYMPDGRLIVARPLNGEVTQIFRDGEVRRFIGDLEFPNAVYPDFTGTVWVSDSDGNKVVRVNPAGEVDVVVSGEAAAGANGVVYDERRKALFFASDLGVDDMTIGRVDFDSDGQASEPVAVIALQEASGDGIAMDGCGNLYIVDNFSPETDGGTEEAGTTKIRRLRLDAKGNMVNSEIIAEVKGSVTNLQWGNGEGFDPASIYTTGFGGLSYRIDVGVIGAPVPVPDFSQNPTIPDPDTDPGDGCEIDVTVTYSGPVTAALVGGAMKDHPATEIPLGFLSVPKPAYPVNAGIVGVDDGQLFTVYVRIDQDPGSYMDESPNDLIGRTEFMTQDCADPISVTIDIQDTYGSCPGEEGSNADDPYSACSGVGEVCRDLDPLGATLCAASCTVETQATDCGPATASEAPIQGKCYTEGSANFCAISCEDNADCPNAGAVCDDGICVFLNE